MSKGLITPARLRWLLHLERFGQTEWGDMPKRTPSNSSFGRGVTSITNSTWGPMVEHRLIEVNHYTPRGCYKHGTYFKLTDLGKGVLALARERGEIP